MKIWQSDVEEYGPQEYDIIKKDKFWDYLNQDFKNGRSERSVIDFVVVGKKILLFVTGMFIDERGKYSLTNFIPIKNNMRAVDSDHHIQYMDTSLRIRKKKARTSAYFQF